MGRRNKPTLKKNYQKINKGKEDNKNYQWNTTAIIVTSKIL